MLQGQQQEMRMNEWMNESRPIRLTYVIDV
jgi:hypothetical protein